MPPAGEAPPGGGAAGDRGGGAPGTGRRGACGSHHARCFTSLVLDVSWAHRWAPS